MRWGPAACPTAPCAPAGGGCGGSSNWLVAEGIITTDPLAGITVGEPEPPPVPIFTDAELTALLDACKGKGFNDLRDAAVIRLFIDCGCRVGELVGIDTKDLDFDGESVAVTGKGSRAGWPTSPAAPGWRWTATYGPAEPTGTPTTRRCSSASGAGSPPTVFVSG